MVAIKKNDMGRMNGDLAVRPMPAVPPMNRRHLYLQTGDQ
jgi:hypothetical protein